MADTTDVGGDGAAAIEEDEMSYRIETRGTDGQWTGNLGDGPNRFDSREDALAAIESLQQIGDDWAGAEYRVVALGAEGEVR